MESADQQIEDQEETKSEELAVIEMMDGDIYSKGIKVSHREWLDNGFEHQATDEQKADAYHAMIESGWDESFVKTLMSEAYPHLTPGTMEFIFEQLHELAVKFPADTSNTDPIVIE